MTSLEEKHLKAMVLSQHFIIAMLIAKSCKDKSYENAVSNLVELKDAVMVNIPTENIPANQTEIKNLMVNQINSLFSSIERAYNGESQMTFDEVINFLVTSGY